jgi:hypothetical protein
MEVCYWALLFMPLVILLYLYSLQIKGDSHKKKKSSERSQGFYRNWGTVLAFGTHSGDELAVMQS